MDRPTATGTGNRFDYLDAVRAVAALSVVLQHLLDRVPTGPLRFGEAGINLGAFGVTLFFIASGVIIPRSAARSGLRRFWTGRFFRLFPLYWLTIVCAVALFPLSLSWREVLVNFTMLQEFLGAPHVLGVYWTLGMEMIFYVLCSVVLFAPGLRRLSPHVLPLLALGGFVSLILLSLLTKHSAPLGRVQLLFASFLGVFFANKRWFDFPTSAKLLGCTAVGTVLTLAAATRFYFVPEAPEFGRSFAHAGSYAASWVAAYATFLAFFHFQDRRFPWWVLLLGTICYSTYLLHPFALAIVPAEWSLLVQLPATLLLSYLLAAASWYCLEKPLIGLGRRLSAGAPSERQHARVTPP